MPFADQIWHGPSAGLLLCGPAQCHAGLRSAHHRIRRRQAPDRAQSEGQHADQVIDGEAEDMLIGHENLISPTRAAPKFSEPKSSNCCSPTQKKNSQGQF